MIMEQQVKFCMNCSLPFMPKWNKNFDPAYKDRDNCCKKCELAYYKKEIKRASRGYRSAPRHGVLA